LCHGLEAAAENPLELSLRQSFRLLEPELRPPFPLKTRTSDECSDLTRAILYGALTEARLARTHVKHLHAVVTDGYALFATLLARIVDELYDRLAEAAKAQVLWAAGEMVDVAAVGFGGLLVALEFGVAGFSDIAQIYSVRTSSRYFLLRLTPEAETQLRFLLTHVKLGSQKRHQTWFASKFFCTPERETLIVDIVRFVCCAHHPPREIIHSNVIPRWAVIGWLLKSCRKNYVEANAKLALFYDWLFFDERVDKVMNIEPALLLMVHSIPHYVELTHTLLEFLFLLVDNYDVERKDMISSRVSSSFTLLINQGLSHNLENLTSAEILSPPLKEKLRCLLSDKRVGIAQEIPPAKTLGHLIPMEVGTAIPEEHLTCIQKDEVGAKSVDASASIPSRLLTITSEVQENDIQKLVKGLGKAIKSSHVSTRELELNGYKLFAPLEHPQDYIDDDERESPTTSIIRKYLSSKNEKLVQLLLFWSRNGFPVGAHLLYYASRLAYEADMAKHRIHELTEDGLHKLINTHVPFLMGHIDCYLTFSDKRQENFPEPLLAAAVLERELAVTV
ncbi:hypothetical protein EUGRSUZ_B03727, partial [Eucalyptus grandis]